MSNAFDYDDGMYPGGSSVDALESAGEAVGQHQMATGARSRLLWCPNCGESNCLTGCLCNGATVATHYDCVRCGKTVEAKDL